MLLNLRITFLVVLTEMNAEITQMNLIACHKDSKILIYCIVSSLWDAVQSKINLLDARADEFFCSRCLGRLQW